MSTEIFVKETTYGSFTIEKDINQENYEENKNAPPVISQMEMIFFNFSSLIFNIIFNNFSYMFRHRLRGQRALQDKTSWKIPILEHVNSMTAGINYHQLK